jgi:hypothetical protein
VGRWHQRSAGCQTSPPAAPALCPAPRATDPDGVPPRPLAALPFLMALRTSATHGPTPNYEATAASGPFTTSRAPPLGPPAPLQSLPPSDHGRLAIIRKMMASAAAQSPLGPASPPAPRPTPPRGRPEPAAAAAAFKVACPMAGGPTAATRPPEGRGGEAPSAPTLTSTTSSTTLELGGPTWPIASDSEVMLEAQLGAFTRLVGPGRPDWRRISFASFLATSQDAARD